MEPVCRDDGHGEPISVMEMHSIWVVQLPFLCTRAQQENFTAVEFLKTSTKHLDEDDWRDVTD